MDTRVAVAVLATAVAALAVAPVGHAKRGDVRVAGVCTASSTAKLKLSEEDGGIEVEFEVDQNRNGVRWVVAIARNGTRVVKTTRVTKSPSGSFTLRVVTPNGPGTDRFVARATSPAGEVCTARAGF
ncbi:MAG: hypothetical protein KatS3mg012_2384 [Gaiellaceae bacterium]|jgi:hypothetical protein|nr:MAG: hypothetical protein KatS3mg012_2384 [Gaiellaceae bacterium]